MPKKKISTRRIYAIRCPVDPPYYATTTAFPSKLAADGDGLPVPDTWFMSGEVADDWCGRLNMGELVVRGDLRSYVVEEFELTLKRIRIHGSCPGTEWK